MKVDPVLTNSRPEFHEFKQTQNEVKINKNVLKHSTRMI